MTVKSVGVYVRVHAWRCGLFILAGMLSVVLVRGRDVASWGNLLGRQDHQIHGPEIAYLRGQSSGFARACLGNYLRRPSLAIIQPYPSVGLPVELGRRGFLCTPCGLLLIWKRV